MHELRPHSETQCHLAGPWLSCSAIKPCVLLWDLLSRNACEELSGHGIGTDAMPPASPCGRQTPNLPILDPAQVQPYVATGKDQNFGSITAFPHLLQTCCLPSCADGDLYTMGQT